MNGHIDHDRTNVLSNFYNRNFEQYLNDRNFTLYLRAPPDITYDRMVSWGRKEETGCVSLEKVRKISELHDKEYLGACSVLKIDESERTICIDSEAVLIVEAIAEIMKRMH